MTMPPHNMNVLAVRYRALALGGLRRNASPFQELPPRLLVVDVRFQRLGLLVGGALILDVPVSTSARGIGCEEGSYKTPPGWHRIQSRMGAGEPWGAVFRAKRPTGERWQGEPPEEDLILSRVIPLEGLEPGVNQGDGRDSFQRYIYLHGTNQEALVGKPVSHGCVRLRNDDVIALADAVEDGEILLIADASCEPAHDPAGMGRLHFVGVGGSGMSALAQFVAMKGGSVSGSDRSFDRGLLCEAWEKLTALGITMFPQDGSGVVGDCCAVVYSTAVEEQVPDFAEAKGRGIPRLHRSELLAHLCDRMRTVAISGTSGKSTTTAMVFEILRSAGMDPSIITGGELVSLQRENLWGNAWAGTSDILVMEADESDGSLVRYHPAVGVVLNLQRDHKEMDVVAAMFQVFREQTREGFVLGEAPNLTPFAVDALRYGFLDGVDVRGEHIQETPEGSRFVVKDTCFHLPSPGRHNIENALAAIAACTTLGLPLRVMVEPLANFQGVARRFQRVGTRRGVQVVDDFAHNPAKVAASLQCAHLCARRVLAIFQPHGYAPTRFLRKDFVETFARELGDEDRLWMLEIFYAGGTAQRDFSAADVVEEIRLRGTQAEFASSREDLVRRIAEEARAGDMILLMGARDPSLSDLAAMLLEAL